MKSNPYQVFLQILAVVCLLAGATSILAMPPQPDLLSAAKAGKLAETPYYLQHLTELHQRGVGQPSDFFKRALAKPSATQVAGATTPFKILAILVQFSDHQSQVNAPFFDSLVFSPSGSTVKHYFNEITYSQIDLVTVNLPSTVGWRTAPNSYAYYVGGQQGLGAYPQNAQKLVEDLVDQVDPLVDFSQYDNNNDGYVDVVMVIHAGRGAEQSGSNSDIWSHKWGISPRAKDGVFVFDYTMQPEYWTSPGDMTIGVYAHELAHGFGLPDLYDTDGSSNGIGRWCIMSYGSWNGPGNRGGSPSHPCAWSRIQMGVKTSTTVSGALANQAVANVEQGGPIYRLWTAGLGGPEYFLVENRQPVGYDAYLPGSGLLIWHIDETKLASETPNDFEWYPGLPMAAHYGVALEQADGLYELEHKTDAGDNGDPFPGSSGKTVFNDTSTPQAIGYNGLSASVQVSNISVSDQVAYANLTATIAAGTDDEPSQTLPNSIDLKQNYPNPFNPSTTIEFSVPVGSHASLEIYNLVGQKVRSLFDGTIETGSLAVEWDAMNDAGKPVASGIYFYRLMVGNQTAVKKMVLMR